MSEQLQEAAVSAPTIAVAGLLDKEPPEVTEAKNLAKRYRMPFIDLLPPEQPSPVDIEELAKLPVDLMLRNQFVPLRREGGDLHAALADPTNLERLDELENVLNVRIVPYVATAGAIDVVLRKGDSTQRVLQEAASGFKMSLLKETENGDEVLDLDRLASDTEMSPIIKLVDTILYNAMESRSSDIHIEAGDRDVRVKFRIDGALYQKVDPIDMSFHQTLISRIKVMSELDIAERRIPQDGRFRVRYKGRTVDFRVSILPSAYGENCVIRILDKEQISEEFKNLSLDVVGFDPDDVARFRLYIKEPYGMVLVTGPTGSGKT
ncbi:MAG: ATPase, T2SS/T4P/T4SS family, partial [Pyrinomonadaceae bacterium]